MANNLTNEYILYLIKQYFEKPKANADIRNLLVDWQNQANFVETFGENFDIDNCRGTVLDLIGRIVGLDRQVNDIIPIVFFGFSNNANARSFTSFSGPVRPSATFFREGQPTLSAYQLQDNEYRRFLKIKIAKNICSPYLVSDNKISLQQVIFDAFGGLAYVTDRKNHTLNLYISDEISDAEANLILKLDILPRPITFSYNLFRGVLGQSFGFSNNPDALGFSSISNPSRVGGTFARVL
jgi:hypothetical protein